METFKQPKLTGYRQLTPVEAELINEIKAHGEATGDLIRRVSQYLEQQEHFEPHTTETSPHRWLALARTDLQLGIMQLVRSVAQPTSF